MLLVKVFNEALKRVPTISDYLEKMISIEKWDKERKEYAVDIVRQIKKFSLCEYKSNMETDPVRFEPLCLVLVTGELDKISSDRDIDKMVEYVKAIIKDINEFSCEIVFEYEGYQFYEESDIFEAEICWYI